MRNVTSYAKENCCMDNVSEETHVTKAKLVEPTSGAQVAAVNKFVANRIANKQRKKRAHRRKLRRSNTKG